MYVRVILQRDSETRPARRPRQSVGVTQKRTFGVLRYVLQLLFYLTWRLLGDVASSLLRARGTTVTRLELHKPSAEGTTPSYLTVSIKIA